MLPVTRHKHKHTGLVTPSLPQLLLAAMLRLFAMLVSSVASTLQMPRRRRPVNATREMPADLPGAQRYFLGYVTTFAGAPPQIVGLSRS